MMMLDEVESGACIKVIGIGGGGGNAVNSMIEAGVEGVQFIVANTDKQALSKNQAEIRIQIGEQRTHGLGAGAQPAVGEAAATESASIIQEQLKGADMVFITAGMGGGTGTGAAPIIAGIAKQLGALTIGVVTKPFAFEGKKRRRQAEMGIENLRKNVDTLITIPNQRLLQISGEELPILDAFRQADSVLVDAVRSISDLITHSGYINTDFADVKTVMQNKGLALMGTGYGEGPNRALDAAEAAISSPLLDDITLSGATDILLNITAPRNATLHEISEAASRIEEDASDDVHLIWGHVINDDETCEQIKITIIATGFGQAEANAEDSPYQSSSANPQFLGMNNYESGPGFMSQSRLPAISMSMPAQSSTKLVAQSPNYQEQQRSPYADSMSSGSMEIANNLQKIQTESDRIYSNEANRGFTNETRRSSYAPTGNTAFAQTANNTYAPVAGNTAAPSQSAPDYASIPDIFAQVKNNERNNPATAQKSRVNTDLSDELNEDLLASEPSYVRRQNKNKSFLD